MQFLQTLGDKKPEEREKELHAYREQAQAKLNAFLKEALEAEQAKRLRQVMLQRDGLFALGRAEAMQELEGQIADTMKSVATLQDAEIERLKLANAVLKKGLDDAAQEN